MRRRIENADKTHAKQCKKPCNPSDLLGWRAVPSNDHGSRGVRRASFANRAVSVSNRLDEIVQAIDHYG